MKFEIEQYELHIMRYRVEATSEAGAIASLLAGDAEIVDGSSEYIEVAEDYGLPVDEYRGLAEELENLGIPVSDDVIPSIRSVKKIG